MSRLLVTLALLATAAPPPPAPLRIKASPAVSPCVAAAALAYQQASGRKLAVETAALFDAASAEGADVVVAADHELNRIIESGTTRTDQDVDVARIPWVLAGAGAGGVDVRALARTKTVVRIMGGAVAREARHSLERQGLTLARLSPRRERSALQLGPGEAAVVPLSLAGPGPVASLDVPPLLVRALGVRASARPDAARAFLDFLGGETGNAAFRACGRPDTP